MMRILSVALVLAVVGVSAAAQDEAVARSEDRAWLGVFLGEATGEGVEVLAVVSRGPAHRGGVHAGDVLVALDDAAIVSPGDVETFLGSIEPGVQVTVRVLRSGRPATRTILAGTRSSASASVSATLFPARELRRRALSGWTVRLQLVSGLSLVAISDELRVHYKAPAGVGVLVTRVGPREAVRSTGLEVGDVLTRVGPTPIRQPADFQSALTVLRPGITLEMEVVRASKLKTLTYVPAEPDQPDPGSAPGGVATGYGVASVVRIRLLEAELQRLEQRMLEIRSELEKLKDTR